ncbi:unnamed protein product [Adineta ricciae]|uniref:Envelope fusion glycoprotein n=1 Tax=Adineta ricciae TaxID=249248 RepID=A0A815QIA6_ADIRI|nr:unnamed protein product [Adineta ricciae]CAF1463653.1 unnamed protein product [Adineta ricciae]
MFSSILLIIFVTNTLIILTNVTATDVIIETQKGIALHNIGVYYEQLEKSIVHILIPFNDLCLTSPTLDVCEYVQSNGPSILEIGTVLPYSNAVSSMYDKSNISLIMQDDFKRVFARHEVDKIVQKARSILYFKNDKFYLPSYTKKTPVDTSIISTNDNRQQTIYRSNNIATLVLEQMFNNKIGFDFLNDEQIAELLPLVDLAHNIKLDITNIEESKQNFINMIFGQTVYALKSCSTKINHNVRNGPQCLVVSTIFREISNDSSSIYQVYRLTPLPVLFNGNQYIYSNLPKVFGINTNERKVILWNNDELSTNCILSSVIYCREYPLTIPLSSTPCLNELIDTELDMKSSSCDVVESKHNQIGILNIVNNIWYIYSPNQLSNCNMHSFLSPSTDKQFATYPLIVQLPCGRPIQCSTIRLPPTKCIDINIILKPKQNRHKRQRSISTIPLSEITTRLVSIYKTASKLTFANIKHDIDSERSFMQKLYEEFGNIFALLLSLLLSTVILSILKVYKRQEAKQNDDMQKRLNRLERDSIHV